MPLAARATLEILIPDFVKQTSEEKPVEGDELEVHHLCLHSSVNLKTMRLSRPSCRNLFFFLSWLLLSWWCEVIFSYLFPQYFNHISIEDSRVYELTNKAGLLSPYQILHECLKRYGTTKSVIRNRPDSLWVYEKNVFTVWSLSIEIMEWVTPASSLKWSQERTRRVNTSWHVGSTQFVAGVSMHAWNESKTRSLTRSNTWIQPHSQCCNLFSVGKNKRVGKQLASQKILQMLHPHVKNWGSLLRMYGRESNKMVKKVGAVFDLYYIMFLLKHQYALFFIVFKRVFEIFPFFRKALIRVWLSFSSMPKRTSQTFTSSTNYERRWWN